MIYHDECEDSLVMETRMAKELRWADLKRKQEARQGWTREEISRVMVDIQEFVSKDFPVEKEITKKQILSAFDDFARAASFIERHTESDPCDYATEKLYGVFNTLEPKEKLNKVHKKPLHYLLGLFYV